MALEKGKHKTKAQRSALIETIELAKMRTGLPIRTILKQAGVPRASYYRYLKLSEPRRRKPKPKAPPLTPFERLMVRETALAHPATGYKSLAWLLQNEHIAGVRPYQVLDLLREEQLIPRREAAAPCNHKKPAAPIHPNEVWHIDLMYLWLASGWWYLVDILDAYSRFVVHWTLNDSLAAETVTLTVLEALERWQPDPKPAIVHDHGSQFISKEWRTFSARHGLPNIRIKVAHPQSNGRIERLHRTHREEGLIGIEDKSSDQARQELFRWVNQYNNVRPHGSLNGLPPVVYYLGEPEAALAQREHFVLAAAKARANYYRQLSKIGCLLLEEPKCLTLG